MSKIGVFVPFKVLFISSFKYLESSVPRFLRFGVLRKLGHVEFYLRVFTMGETVPITKSLWEKQ